MKLQYWLAGLATGATIAAAEPVFAAEKVTPPQTVYSFGTYRPMTPAAVQTKLQAALQAAGKYEATRFTKAWGTDTQSLRARFIAVLSAEYPAVAAALAEAQAADILPPSTIPPIITDPQLDSFLRSNLAAAYTEALARRRSYEESLTAAAVVKPEELADPASYFFYKAVAEYSLGAVKTEYRAAAMRSISRLLDDVLETPDRYRMVATLMFFDIQRWSKDPKDLANIGRLMDNSGRRLELAKGGPQTQDIQKRIVFRLDEKIKELEKKQKGGGGGGGGSDGQCPSGGPPGGGSTQSSGPAGDSTIMGGSGEGKVDEKKLRHYAEVWGKLPAAERAKAVQEITRDLPPKFKPMIEDYFKSLNRIHGVRP
ncbi:MAG: hypothetical protein LC104_18125 [Bacteroidales bacterium]|nr:hypothetical protein [Bacteroidales bacterium]